MNVGSTITIDEIINHVGTRNYERGLNYFYNGALHYFSVDEDIIKARCKGSRNQTYRVRVDLSKDLESGCCSCPVGFACKHIAALLIAWLEIPEAFQDGEHYLTLLQSMDKNELIELIQKMIANYPELERLLAVKKIAGCSENTDISKTLTTIAREIDAVLNNIGYDYDSVAKASYVLNDLMEIPTGFLEKKNYKIAADIFKVFTDKLTEVISEIHDEQGDIGEILYNCIEGLEQCIMNARSDSVTRSEIIQTLYGIFDFDTKVGGFGWGDKIPEILTSNTSRTEKALISQLLQNSLKSATESMNWAKRNYGSFYLELNADTITNEEYIKVCRQTRLDKQLVKRLLEIGNVKQANIVARKTQDHCLNDIADIFIEHSHESHALEIVMEQYQTNKSHYLREWLENYYIRCSDFESALKMVIKKFYDYPKIDDYGKIKELAEKAGSQPETVSSIIFNLETKKAYDVLTKIYIHEQDLEKALKSFEKVSKGSAYNDNWGSSLASTLASALEKSDPEKSVEIYLAISNNLISLRGRTNYARACSYLKQIRSICKKINNNAKWERTLSQIKLENSTLRALFDEMKQAGLGA